MKKYYIGLIVITLISLGLIGFTLSQGANNKKDKETEKKAQEIADKLNGYMSDKYKIPAKLDEVGIKDVPATVRYTKKSDKEFEFCITYKSASNFDTGGVTSLITANYFQGFAGNAGSDYYSSDYKPASLYLPYSHKKGENCQTVEPYLDNYLGNTNYEPDSYTQPTTTKSEINSTPVTANDNERKVDLLSLQSQIEAYYAQNGIYPTILNMNDSSWRTSNMKALDKEALKDPAGTGYTLTSFPTKKAYSYDVKASDGGSCNNTTYDCVEYVLTATFDSGSLFTKKSLN